MLCVRCKTELVRKSRIKGVCLSCFTTGTNTAQRMEVLTDPRAICGGDMMYDVKTKSQKNRFRCGKPHGGLGPNSKT